jgi:hypothetical protein
MATFRVSALRNTISGAAPYLRGAQRRWAQVHDVRFLVTQSGDRVLERYKEKLDQKAKEYVHFPSDSWWLGLTVVLLLGSARKISVT